VNWVYFVQEMFQWRAQGRIYSCEVLETIKMQRPLSARKTLGHDIVFSLLSLFWKNRVGLWDHAAVCVCVYPPIVASQRLGGNRGNEYTRNNRRIVGRVVFNMARVVSRKVGK
jgi:hypothetical protein